MAKEKLVNTALVPADDIKTKEYTPASGEKVLIAVFEASVPSDPLVDAQILWDGVELWVIQGEHPMPSEVWFEVTGDGTKKVVLCLSNRNQTTAYIFSAYTTLEITPAPE